MKEIKFRIFTGKEMINPELIDLDNKRSADYYNFYDSYAGECIISKLTN